MVYVEWTVGEKTYKLRLGAKQVADLEKRLGGASPLSIFAGVEDNQMPQLNKVLLVLHASLVKYQHGLKEEDIYDIYDEYVEKENKSLTDLIPVLVEVFKSAGLIPKDIDVENEEQTKN